jgi:hypothetical protein
MRSPLIRAVILTIVLAGSTQPALPAEDSGLRGPVMGYVLDRAAHAIRPVNGIPGSSVLGHPLALPFQVDAAAFSPVGDYGIAVSAADDRTAHVLRNLGGTPNVDPVEGAIIGADRVVLNVDANAAALLASDARRLQLVRGLPDSPTVAPALDLSSIPGTITAIALDRSGTNVLIATDQGALYLSSADMYPRLIANFGLPTALALLNDDQDVVVADAAVNQLILLRRFAATPESFLLASERDGVSAPAALQISSDSRKLYVANGASRTLDIWSLEQQSIEASLPLDVAPTRLTALQRASTFLLNDTGEHPLLLLNLPADDAQPAIYFVPANRDQ